MTRLHDGTIFGGCNTLCQNWVPSENQIYLNNGVMRPHIEIWPKVDRSLGYMMVSFLGGATHLRRCHSDSKNSPVMG